MRRSLSPLLAASLFAIAAAAATRPHYGGTLRAETRSAIASLDPAIPEAGAKQRVAGLIFENLVAFDGSGMPQPRLAIGWQHDAEYRHWEIEIRAGIKFQNGELLTSTVAAESLRKSLAPANAKIYAESGHVTIESESPASNLLAELAQPRNAIVSRPASGDLSGTGPFKFVAKPQKKQISLAASRPL